MFVIRRQLGSFVQTWSGKAWSMEPIDAQPYYFADEVDGVLKQMAKDQPLKDGEHRFVEGW